ncbi:general stress protein [Bacillus carboniphilus]
MMKVQVVENGLQAARVIEEWIQEGYSRELIYLFALNENRSENLTHWTETGDMSLMELGFGETIENFFRPRDRELYSMFTSLGIDSHYAYELEADLERGRIVMVGVHK